MLKESMERKLPEVTLREFSREDVPALFALVDRARGHFSQFGDTTAEKFSNEEEVLKLHFDQPNPRRIDFCLWTEGTLVGIVSLTMSRVPDGPIEVGYALGQEFLGKGYATTALLGSIEYVRRLSGGNLSYFRAHVHSKNEKSIAVLERSGFSYSHPHPLIEDVDAYELEFTKPYVR